MVMLWRRDVANASTPMTPSDSPSGSEAVVNQLQACILSADNSSVASSTSTSNSPNLTAQEGSEESEPRNAITDLFVDGYSDNTIGKRKRLDKETGDIIATETIGDNGKGSSARPGKLRKVVPVHTYFESLTWMRKTSRVITNVLEDCQETLKLVRAKELVHKSVVEAEGYSAKDTTVHSYTEIGTLLERQEENLEKLRLYIQQRWAKESKENGKGRR
ncbi:hypothetical protein V501_00350 [Pseudogymnoascus sp. VKM F-4519 (FW-2642)]|nr:hypothetical protein V501_00350 [Pseudogymnoascus sp. VKM F-4519 (FW-2642)]OBT59288.1 hypothetical protein VE04_00392 [Pseudogymnoascus sp. 24MN13]